MAVESLDVEVHLQVAAVVEVEHSQLVEEGSLGAFP